MAWYDVTFSCGHTDRVQLYGPGKERDRWIEWAENSGLCPECYEEMKRKQYEEKVQKAQEEAQEWGLPELTGTEKQIAWANVLRQNAIKEFKVLKEHIKDEFLAETFGMLSSRDFAEMLFNRILKRETTAKWWIENAREASVNEIAQWIAREYTQFKAEQEVPAEVKQQALDELTIRPENPNTSLIAEIHIKDDTVIAKYPEKSEAFRDIVKKLGFTWADGNWQRKTGFRTGSPLDRASELGVKLLAAGFPVRVFNDELQRKILASDYEPECKRWITKHIKTDRFLVDWKRPDDFFDEAKKLPGARWESGTGMLVPKEAFREVLDFANQYGFKLSPGAQELVEEARGAYEAAMIAEVKPQEEQKLPKPGRKVLKAVDVTGDIDDELRDDD